VPELIDLVDDVANNTYANSSLKFTSFGAIVNHYLDVNASAQINYSRFSWLDAVSGY
jgi:hypothetical protein